MIFANICLEIFALLVTITFLVGNYQDNNRNKSEWKIMSAMLWTNIVLLLCYLFTWICDNNVKYSLVNKVFTWGTFSAGYIIGVWYSLYVKKCIATKKRTETCVIYVTIIIYLFATMLSIVMTINGMYFKIYKGSYYRGPLFWLNQLLVFAAIAPIIILLLVKIKKIGFRKAFVLISYGVIPLAALAIQNTYEDIDAISVATTLSIIVIYLGIHVEQEKQEMYELAELKMNTMFSQMNPHFIYNTLGLIQDMCYEKAPDAEETIVQFSEFLRVNIDAVKQKKLIPFEQELNHTKNYLMLEQKRFGEMLEVEYNIQTMDFLIPPLTLQPIVENAVYHGIMKLEDGGKLFINVSENSKMYIINIVDSGIGFEDEEIDEEINTKGIINVRIRLEMMCDGKLNVKSSKNSGTIVEITIPKKR